MLNLFEKKIFIWIYIRLYLNDKWNLFNFLDNIKKKDIMFLKIYLWLGNVWEFDELVFIFFLYGVDCGL